MFNRSEGGIRCRTVAGMYHPPVEAFGLGFLRKRGLLVSSGGPVERFCSRRERKPKASTGGWYIPAVARWRVAAPDVGVPERGQFRVGLVSNANAVRGERGSDGIRLSPRCHRARSGGDATPPDGDALA